jgi:hypothetical protein
MVDCLAGQPARCIPALATRLEAQKERPRCRPPDGQPIAQDCGERSHQIGRPGLVALALNRHRVATLGGQNMVQIQGHQLGPARAAGIGQRQDGRIARPDWRRVGGTGPHESVEILLGERPPGGRMIPLAFDRFQIDRVGIVVAADQPEPAAGPQDPADRRQHQVGRGRAGVRRELGLDGRRMLGAELVPRTHDAILVPKELGDLVELAAHLRSAIGRLQRGQVDQGRRGRRRGRALGREVSRVSDDRDHVLVGHRSLPRKLLPTGSAIEWTVLMLKLLLKLNAIQRIPPHATSAVRMRSISMQLTGGCGGGSDR